MLWNDGIESVKHRWASIWVRAHQLFSYAGTCPRITDAGELLRAQPEYNNDKNRSLILFIGDSFEMQKKMFDIQFFWSQTESKTD
jgi:hypothetical protein